jgi:serine/threonine protein kinase
MDRAWKAKLCDFGLAATPRPSAGTPAYMAPELLDGRAYSDKVDVYAFGVLLNEMHSRTPPFAGVDEQRLCAVVASGRRPEHAASLSRAMAELIGRCWDESVAARPGFAEVTAALQGMTPGK